MMHRVRPLTLAVLLTGCQQLEVLEETSLGVDRLEEALDSATPRIAGAEAGVMRAEQALEAEREEREEADRALEASVASGRAALESESRRSGRIEGELEVERARVDNLELEQQRLEETIADAANEIEAERGQRVTADARSQEQDALLRGDIEQLDAYLGALESWALAAIRGRMSGEARWSRDIVGTDSPEAVRLGDGVEGARSEPMVHARERLLRDLSTGETPNLAEVDAELDVLHDIEVRDGLFFAVRPEARALARLLELELQSRLEATGPLALRFLEGEGDLLRVEGEGQIREVYRSRSARQAASAALQVRIEGQVSRRRLLAGGTFEALVRLSQHSDEPGEFIRSYRARLSWSEAGEITLVLETEEGRGTVRCSWEARS